METTHIKNWWWRGQEWDRDIENILEKKDPEDTKEQRGQNLIAAAAATAAFLSFFFFLGTQKRGMSG